jgi:hypothetical protein
LKAPKRIRERVSMASRLCDTAVQVSLLSSSPVGVYLSRYRWEAVDPNLIKCISQLSSRVGTSRVAACQFLRALRILPLSLEGQTSHPLDHDRTHRGLLLFAQGAYAVQL